MNILILNGSPRQNGNTKKMVTAFCEGAADGQTLMGKLPWGVLQHAQGVF